MLSHDTWRHAYVHSSGVCRHIAQQQLDRFMGECCPRNERHAYKLGSADRNSYKCMYAAMATDDTA